MELACIRHTDLPGTSKLFADLAYRFEQVAAFYRHNPFDAQSFSRAAAQIDYPAERRDAMTRALAAQNPGNPLIEQFARPGTVAVVTGQQVGLFTGPVYTLYKALTAVKLARQLSAQGISAVPVFWLATEDHDFDEVATAWVYGANRQPVSLKASAQGTGQRPVGGIVLENLPVEALRDSLRDLPFCADVMAAVAETYRPGVPMGAAFRELLRRLLGKAGVLTLDPLDPAVRAIGTPLMTDAVKAAPQLKAALLDRSKELEKAGYHAQVLIEPKTSLFFLLEGGERRTLRLADTEYASLADRAAHVSPNALLRPVWQDFLLPTVSYIGGPGELAYFAQSQVLYERLLGRMPVVFPRAGFTVMSARSGKLLDRHKLTLTETLTRQDLLRDRVAQSLIPASLAQNFAGAERDLESRLDRLRADVLAFDPTLAAAIEKSTAKIRYQVQKSRQKVERETLRRDARATAEAAELTGAFFPERHLQERLYSALPFLAEHGMDFTDRIYDAVQLDCPDHRIIRM